jgi:beta-lactam-binding protein with PASTA domain
VALLRRRRRAGPARTPDPEATAPLERPAARETVYEESVPAEAPPPRIWPWLLLLLVALAIGLGVVYALTQSDDDNSQPKTTTPTAAGTQVDVPRVVGQPADQAAATLIDAGLKPEFQRQLSKKPSGIVLEQAPAAASSVGRGTTVVLTISRGRDTVGVPALTGLRLAEALKKLQAVKLQGTAKSVASEKPAGQVIAQTPGGGRELKRGATVQLTVSEGRQKVAVPAVVGEDRATATRTLEEAGFQAAVLEVPSSEPNGTVVAQNPKPNDQAAKGSKVQINVSKGSAPGTTTSAGGTTTTTVATPAPVTVPDVVGLKQAGATRKLQTAGFKVDVRTVPSQEPTGTVVAQYPAAGETARRGGTIRINVSRGDGRTEVPDVVGLAEATAKQKLQQAGFTVTVVDQDTSDPTEDGNVVDQVPPGGERRKRGAEITIYVGVLTS